MAKILFKKTFVCNVNSSLGKRIKPNNPSPITLVSNLPKGVIFILPKPENFNALMNQNKLEKSRYVEIKRGSFLRITLD